MSKKIISIILLAADDIGAMEFGRVTAGGGWYSFPSLLAGDMPTSGGQVSSSTFLAAYGSARTATETARSSGTVGIVMEAADTSGGFVPAGTDLTVSFRLGLGHGWANTYWESYNNFYTYDFTEPDNISRIQIVATPLYSDLYSSIILYDSNNGVDGAFTYSSYYSDNAYGTQTLVESNLFFNKSFYIEQDIVRISITIEYSYDVSLITSDWFYIVFDTLYARYVPHSSDGDIYNILMSIDDVVAVLEQILQSQNLNNQVLSLFYELVDLIFTYLTDLQTQYFDDICEKLNGIVTMLNNEGMQLTQIIQVMDAIRWYVADLPFYLESFDWFLDDIDAFLKSDIFPALDNIENYLSALNSTLSDMSITLEQIQQLVNYLYANSNITQEQLDEIIDLLGGLSVELEQTIIETTETDSVTLLDLVGMIFKALLSLITSLFSGIINIFSHIGDLFSAFSYSDTEDYLSLVGRSAY